MRAAINSSLVITFIVVGISFTSHIAYAGQETFDNLSAPVDTWKRPVERGLVSGATIQKIPPLNFILFMSVLLGGAIVAKKVFGKNFSQKAFIGLMAWIIFFLFWELAFHYRLLTTTLIAAPTDILWKFNFHIQQGYLQMHVIATLNRFFVAFAMAVILAIPFGIIAGISNKLYEWVAPSLNFLRMIPPPAILPFLIILFGIGEAPAIFVITLGAFFPIFISIIRGIHSTETSHCEVIETMGGSKIDVLVHAIFPSAIPALFTGLRLGFSVGWLVLISAEAVAIDRGVGFIVQSKFDAPLVFMGLVIICVIGLVIDFSLKWGERFFGSPNRETMAV